MSEAQTWWEDREPPPVTRGGKSESLPRLSRKLRSCSTRARTVAPSAIRYLHKNPEASRQSLTLHSVNSFNRIVKVQRSRSKYTDTADWLTFDSIYLFYNIAIFLKHPVRHVLANVCFDVIEERPDILSNLERFRGHCGK